MRADLEESLTLALRIAQFFRLFLSPTNHLIRCEESSKDWRFFEILLFRYF